MATLYNLSRFSRGFKYLNRHVTTKEQLSSFCTVVQQPKSKSLFTISLVSVIVGSATGVGYAFLKRKDARRNIALEGTEIKVEKLKQKPTVPISRQVIFPEDKTGLKLTLFQYQTCPFCCKVRAFLDYYGISYDVVEVDPVLRNEISWSSYKKVPILLPRVDDGYQPLNDSSMIISLLASYLNDNSHNIDELIEYYPSIGTHDKSGKFKLDIFNKYFLMHQKAPNKEKNLNNIVEERKWRKWADEVLVHTLSPNVYRTLDEAYETFQWFSEVGKWEDYFPLWERMIIINVGACAMWLIAKRLKKRHNLKDNVRQSLYDEANYWLNQIGARGSLFMGGENPDLSDLAVYGILKSIEGSSAFKDLMINTNIGSWYSAMTEKVDSHAGHLLIN